MTFDEWWDKEIDDSENPYTKDSPIYWAFAGWQARGGEVKHWKELAAYRLALLMKMPEDKQWAALAEVVREVEAKLKKKNHVR